MPLPGNRGRLGSEPGKVGGGCCGREGEDCADCEVGGGSGVGGGAGPGGRGGGGGARVVCGRVSGVGLAEGGSGRGQQVRLGGKREEENHVCVCVLQRLLLHRYRGGLQ